MNYLAKFAIVAVATVATFFFFHAGPQDLPSNPKVETSLKQLKSEKPDDRIIALFNLAELLNDPANAADLTFAIPPIVRAVADNDDLVRTSAKISLEQIGEPAAKHLDKFMHSKQFRTYGIGCEAIRTLGPDAKMWLPELQKRLQRLSNDPKDEPYLIATIEALAAIGSDARPALDDALKYLEHKNFKVAVAVCKLVVNIGPDAKPHGPRLVYLMSGSIPSTRSYASMAIGAIGPHEDYDAVALLTEKLSAFLLIDKQRALDGLARMGPKAKAAETKVEALMNDRSKNAMPYAAYTLWKITGNEQPALDVLQNLIESRTYGNEAIQILGRMGPVAKSAVPDLVKQLKSPEPERRENAVWALGDIGPDANSAVEQLENLASDDEDVLIREIAKIVIKMINPPPSR